MKKLFNLQLFAEGAASGAATAGEGSADSAVAAQGELSATEGAQTQKATFDELIKGEYKADYEAAVNKHLDKRLRSHKKTEDELKTYKDLAARLSVKYGTDSSTPEALMQAMDADKTYYEQVAYERGTTPDQVRAEEQKAIEVKRSLSEYDALKRQMEETQRQEEARKIYEGWLEESMLVKQKYPTFDLDTELKNPDFERLMRVPGMKVDTAYTVIHKDDIISGAMQYTAEKVKEKTVNDIMSKQSRPSENGVTSNSTVITKTDPSKLTSAQLADIRKRVAAGERITFKN